MGYCFGQLLSWKTIIGCLQKIKAPIGCINHRKGCIVFGLVGGRIAQEFNCTNYQGINWYSFANIS